MRLLIVCQVVDSEHHNLGFFVRWIEEFAKNCEHVTVIANEVGAYTLPDNVTVLSLGKEKGASRMLRYWRFIQFITTRVGEYDAVFSHMNPEFVIAGGWWWSLTNKKVIMWYVHGTVSLRLRLALAFVTAACTVNKESLRITSPKVHVVGHGIDTEFFKPGYRLKHDEALIVSAGRLSPSKHIDRIIDAAKIVHAEGTPLRLSIIGGPGLATDQGYEEALHIRARDEQYIKFLGPQNQEFVRDAVASADICVNASTTNSVDKAVLEAMAAGAVPITNNRAFKDMLEPLGLFVREESAQALAACISDVLKRDLTPLRDRVREIVVQNHALPSLITKILELYA